MQLRSSGKQNKSRLAWITDTAAACLLSAGLMVFLGSAFGLQWSVEEALSGSPLQGLLSVCNNIAEHLGRTDYIILRRYAAGMQADGSMAPQGFFLTLAFLLLFLLAFLVVRSRSRCLLLLFILPAAVLVAATDAAPGPAAGLLYAFCLLCGMAVCEGSQMPKRKENRTGNVETRPPSGWNLILPAAALTATMLLGLGLDQLNELHAPDFQKKASAVIQRILDSRYGHNPLGEGSLNDLVGTKLTRDRGNPEQVIAALRDGGGDFSDIALTVTQPASSAAESYYLRGFIGECYEGNRWESLDKAVCYEAGEDLYWLHEQGFDGLSQMAEAAAAAGGQDNSAAHTIQVQVQKADRALLYLPYEMTGTDTGIPEGSQNYAGAYLRTNRLFGSREYSLSCTGNVTGKWTDEVGRLYEADQTEALNAYFISESHYNRWCYEQYTHVPDRLRSLLFTLAGTAGDISRDHAPYKETIENVQACLEKNFIYSQTFEALPEDEDFLEHFIRTGKGCDAHYASLATELFRYYGIPARYVSGYLLTPRDLQQGGNGTPLSVRRSHNHAWTEIYIDGYGWVPIEVTPEYGGIMQEADMSRGLQAVSYPQDNPPSQAEEDQTAADGDMEQHYGRFLRWLLGLGGLLLLALILWLLRHRIRRRLDLRRRRRLFRDPDPGLAVRAMFGYMLDEKIPLSQRAEELGNLAAFSPWRPDEGMRLNMRREMEWGEHEKKLLDKQTRRSAADHLSDLLHRLRRRSSA